MTTTEKELQSKITSQKEIGDYLVAAGFTLQKERPGRFVYESGESLPITQVAVYADGWEMSLIVEDFYGSGVTRDVDEGVSLWDLRVSLKAVDEVL